MAIKTNPAIKGRGYPTLARFIPLELRIKAVQAANRFGWHKTDRVPWSFSSFRSGPEKNHCPLGFIITESGGWNELPSSGNSFVNCLPPSLRPKTESDRRKLAKSAHRFIRSWDDNNINPGDLPRVWGIPGHSNEEATDGEAR